MDKVNILQTVKDNKKELQKLMFWAFILIIVDQISKITAQACLENAPDIVLIPDFLSLHFLRNEITHMYQYVVYFILVLIAFPVVFIQSLGGKYNKLITAGLVLLWSAVFSNNIIDVYLLGYIRDFINLEGVAVGNIGDQYRNIGALLIIAGLVIQKRKEISAKTIAIIILSLLAVLILIIIFWRYLARYMAI